MAGSYHGVMLEPRDLIAAAHRAGRPAAERTTLYDIRARYPAPAAPELDLADAPSGSVGSLIQLAADGAP